MASLLQTPALALIRILICSASCLFSAPGQSWRVPRLKLRLCYTTVGGHIDCFSTTLSCLVRRVGEGLGARGSEAVAWGVKSFAVKFSYLKTRRLPGSGVPPAVQCLIWRIIPLWRSPIFVITHEEWEETSACQHFEERRKTTTKDGAASHKGFPICSLQLFLFRELVERPVLSQPESGSQSWCWFLSGCWLEANIWRMMTLFLLLQKCVDCVWNWLLSSISRCLDVIRNRTHTRITCSSRAQVAPHLFTRLAIYCMHVLTEVLETKRMRLCTNIEQFVHCVCLFPDNSPP